MLIIPDELKRLFLDNPEIKIAFGAIAVSASWVFNGEFQALVAILSLVTIDLITGTQYAIRTNSWSSKRSSQGIAKYFRYLTYMFIARMVDKVVPIPFFAPLMDSYIVINEAGSILENFDRLGHNVPLFLIDKLKNFFSNDENK